MKSDNNSSSFSQESQWFHQLYMQAPVAIGIYMGEDLLIEMANPAMCEIWARPLDQVLHKPLFEALPEVSKQGFEEILENVLQSGESFTGKELPATLERGGKMNLCYFNILYKALRDDEDNIVGIIQTATEVTELVKARQMAERNEEILKLSIEAGKMGTWYVDFVQGTTTRSPGYEELFGMKAFPADWSTDDFWSLLLDEDRPYAMRAYEQAKSDGELFYEARVLWPDRSIHWIHVKGKTSFNLKGQAVSMSGIVMDITTQKEAIEKERKAAMEKAARQEEKRQNEALKELFMGMPALIATLRGPTFIFDLVNPAYQQFFQGRHLKDLSILEALPELKDQPIIPILEHVYNTGTHYIGNEVAIPLDPNNTGKLSTHYFNFVYQAMRNSEGQVSGILVFAYEVTEQLNARQRAERSEESLRIALEAGEMGTWSVDLENGEVSHSQQHDSIFGYKAPLKEWSFEELLGHVMPSEKEYVRKELEKARSSGQLNLELQIRTSKGNRWITIKGKTFYEEKMAVRMAGVVIDITEIKQKNLELERINNDLDNFVYTASHDLRAPITNLEGLMIALRETILEKADQREKMLLDMMGSSMSKLNKTIRDLVEFTKMQHENAIASLEEISFEEVFEEIKSDVQYLLDEIQPEVRLDFQVPTIVYKRPNLRSILYNLFSNAIKYNASERASVIEINTYLEESTVVLTVKDNGLGLSNEQQLKLFQMFKRLHTHVEGTGIGLYTVKRIIESNGGKLEVRSKLHEGSEFIVHFLSI